jgi:homospermidine synthase
MRQPQRVLIIGCGSVSQCTLPLLLREKVVTPAQITVLDMVDNRSKIAEPLAAGVTYQLGQITPESLDAELSGRLGAGDICLDLAWNIDTSTPRPSSGIPTLTRRRRIRCSGRCTCGTWRCDG